MKLEIELHLPAMSHTGAIMVPAFKPSFRKLGLFLSLAFATNVAAQTIEIFDVDPIGLHDCRNTSPASINNRGDVTGVCSDLLVHGFVRDSEGNAIFFDAPNANGDTEPKSINDEGDIVGDFTDTDNLKHSFLRERDGTFIVFDGPNGSDTEATSINNAGEITGVFFDGTVTRGRAFVRDHDGNFVVFDGPDTNGAVHDTVGVSINDSGVVVGSFALIADKSITHSFVRDRQGVVTVIDAPNAGTQLAARSINAGGEIAGSFTDALSRARRGFVRDRDGTFSVFDGPTGNSMEAISINDIGDVAGTFAPNPPQQQAGFVRTPQGEITAFNPDGRPTIVSGINNRGEVVGFFIDPQNGLHGFIARF